MFNEVLPLEASCDSIAGIIATAVHHRLVLVMGGESVEGGVFVAFKDRQRQLAYQRAYYRSHRKEYRAYQTAYKGAHREESRASRRAYVQAQKLEIFKAYGGAICVCCSDTHMEFLTLDHIGGDGAIHRRQLGRLSIYSLLKKQGYPPGFRVLCMNCNFALGTAGYCPHGKAKIEPEKAFTKFERASQQLSLLGQDGSWEVRLT
mgnify:CR=1 FL=1